MTNILKSKIPLLWATRVLSELCQQVDESQELDGALVQAFQGAGIALSEAIDRRKALMWSLEGNLKAARGARAEIDEYVQKLKLIQERIKQTTREAMELDPDLPWKDSVGRKLLLRKNSSPRVNHPFDVKETRTFTNLVDHDTLLMFGIPPKYLNVLSVTTLNTEMIKKDLMDGVKLDWADLEHGNHVRGLMPKEDEL